MLLRRQLNTSSYEPRWARWTTSVQQFLVVGLILSTYHWAPQTRLFSDLRTVWADTVVALHALHKYYYC
jgi:hypothetical protein